MPESGPPRSGPPRSGHSPARPPEHWPRRAERGDPDRPSTESPTRPVAPHRGRPQEAPTERIPVRRPARPGPRHPEPDADVQATQPRGKAARMSGPGWEQAPPPREAPPERPVRRPVRREPRPGLGSALLTTAAATVAPGLGHLILGRRRTGVLLLGAFLLGVLGVVALATAVPSSELLERLLSTRVLIVAAVSLLAASLAWIAVIVRTYLLARPRGMRPGRRILGATVVAALCLLVATPLGLAANLANSQRNLLDALFPGGGGGDPAALDKPRINILLLGSDAGPDRTGTRTDTMMVASVDTRTSRTILFALPRNIQNAPFPPGSEAARQFPDGFQDDAAPNSGDYLLNAVYAYGHAFPDIAPEGPTADPGLNLLQSSISHMLGLPIDYYLEVNMAGFASIIDALGGLIVDVGPERIPIGGITPSGREVRPTGYIEPGVQQLDGEEALAFARSRTGSSDYVRMGRQRCLIQYVLDQKSPTDLLTNFQAVARATTNSVATNIPQQVLPALVSLAGDAGSVPLESVSFDPNLPDPNQPDGRFDPADPEVSYMREVVREAIARDPAAAAPTTTSAAPTTTSSRGADSGDDDGEDSGSGAGATTSATPEPSAGPTPIAQSC